MTPRLRKGRCCQPFSGDTFYKPRAVPLAALEIVDLGQDELEAMRLCDFEELDQEQAAQKMNISRGTIQRLLYSGRKKIIDVITNAKALKIIGGEHIVPPPRCSPGRSRRWRSRGRI
ncbi:hypothetical protein A2291_08705 [candidate division WOR-1 bacterium RIFOXYB2_FULL_42_35]|uniref:UPF0251 protein A2462_02295 n=1 Tax=candidate division WOR-1 bacterium RIFOXYC2_FULL_41_25 TaxID=1802586 RepID=A0A1F4TLR8_UNCSA|nr:MAG: hypothetical protein A2291_08705 [candidate division WOR-1 bacterium RIFOXYB2_FULL_42_35]OGC23083.1 MAG: hypothetical protein A2247_08605 [candidate division WOR-1 bacterium RIFOXYA2_FULL_41_14]OGC33655.1 MAG: hypothetical protein A2462_02295 [candidate division WOR-1 bacterium RIFOXYC2_FULL_41_25]